MNKREKNKDLNTQFIYEVKVEHGFCLYTVNIYGIFRGYLILVILAVKKKIAKICRQYYMQSLIKAQIKMENLMSI